MNNGLSITIPKLAFLHTSAVHIQTFNTLIEKLGLNVEVIHKVDESLLSRAQIASNSEGLTKDVQKQVKLLANEGARVVVCTCSSIGAITENLTLDGDIKTFRIDRAMADKAVLEGRNILVLAALESTLTPTYDLLVESANNLQQQVNFEIIKIPQAWGMFEKGEIENYHQCIADFIKTKANDYDVIVLAQASMAGAAKLCLDLSTPILSSPELGLIAAVKEL
jgi:hypothetical protein